MFAEKPYLNDIRMFSNSSVYRPTCTVQFMGHVQGCDSRVVCYSTRVVDRVTYRVLEYSIIIATNVTLKDMDCRLAAWPMPTSIFFPQQHTCLKETTQKLATHIHHNGKQFCNLSSVKLTRRKKTSTSYFKRHRNDCRRRPEVEVITRVKYFKQSRRRPPQNAPTGEAWVKGPYQGVKGALKGPYWQ